MSSGLQVELSSGFLGSRGKVSRLAPPLPIVTAYQDKTADQKGLVRDNIRKREREREREREMKREKRRERERQ